jgi:RNA polymerase sigma factor (sigma-70 family)
MNGLSDNELVQRVIAGDTTAHSLFVERFHCLVWALVTRLFGSFSRDIREDAYQEVFLRLHCGLSTWSGGNLGIWVGRVAVNHLLNLRKTLSRRKESAWDDAYDPPTHGETPLGCLLRREWLEAIGRSAEQCLAELPEPRRMLVELLMKGHSPAEIQSTLGIPRSTFYYWLQDIRNRFRSLLGEG